MVKAIIYLCLLGLLFSCKPKLNANEQMVQRLKEQIAFANTVENEYAPAAVLKHLDSVINAPHLSTDVVSLKIKKAIILLQLGKEQQAVNLMDSVLNKTFIADYLVKQAANKTLALCYLRLGERTNCIHNHSAESCIFPIAGNGIHTDKAGSEKAIELYKKLLKTDPYDYESRWLLNIAYMTTGGYPGKVPAQLLLNMGGDSTKSKPFKEVAMNLGLAVKKISGGSIIDDFDNDGYNDIVTSSASLAEPMHYFHNNKNGSFTDLGKSSGLSAFTGGLNMMQTDYNNDGFKDIFVVRGGWKGKFGKEPNSLLKNNGNGTFTDVTEQSGLLSFHPTQTATWADFNNDGWLDVFIGNESAPGSENVSELYISNKNGTFTEQAATAGCAVNLFVKGVTSGDYDNDGRPDLYISTMNGSNKLLKNQTVKNGRAKFTDVTAQAGLPGVGQATFSTWFFDYDNDGNLDLLACGYGNDTPIADIAGQEALGNYRGNNGKVILYHNNGMGQFENVSVKVGLTKIAFAMGANFGDIDNDGFPDFYLGTGNPQFSSLVPNKLYRNNNGQSFTDITASARVGSLQKGHGVSFADLDNDGYQDIHVSLGGAFIGDAYQNALFINPASAQNQWIDIALVGKASNRAAIGAKLKVTFTANGQQRSVYREVNSGGSFGANPLEQHIGVGKSTQIDAIEVFWPVTGQTQRFKQVKTGSHIKITEGKTGYVTSILKRFNFAEAQPHRMDGMNM
ncbi:CRTAC1 family protein [Mucilaginibacter sp. CSA2-8R]|uniref:CRTAC1 family protein n=1 Tax=Mucilaginibacter sp. CSA2-8R TaxID=3141542 RepID=UPI00315C9058